MKYLPSINGFRAISIIIVIIKHLIENNKIEPLPSIFNIFQNGQLGVSIFFVLSGFLITRLLIFEHEQNGKISLYNFYLRRTLRIFPAYYFLLACYFIFQIIGNISISQMEWISSITFTKQFFRVGWLFRHLWSISVEEIFYLIFPLIFIFFVDNKKFSSGLLWSILILFPLFRITGNILMPSVGHFNIFFRGDAILTGCLVALHYDFFKTKISNRLILAILCISFLIAFHFIPNSFQSKYWILTLIGPPGESLIDFMIIMVLIVYGINSEQTILFKILNSNILNFIGLISYSLYLWQQFFTSAYDFGIFTLYPFNLIFLFVVAMSSYFFIEKPFLRLKSRLISSQ